MLLNNHNGLKLVIYNNESQSEKALNPYTTKAIYKTLNIYDEKVETSKDYFDFEIDNLKEVRKNHIEANKKRNICFICDKTLYIPVCKVLNIETIETRKEYKKGCISISYDEIITFSEDIKIIVNDSVVYFAKKTDKCRYNNEDIKSISEELQKAKETKLLFAGSETKREKYIKLLEEKQKAGFDYLVFAYNVEKTTGEKVYFSNPVSKYEKSKEYIHAEKVQEALNKCIYKNNQLSIYEVLSILEKCNISIKRK